MMFNTILAQAEAFKDNMKRLGIDLDAGQIILPRERRRG
jgi:hypothetical protein